MAHTHGGTEHGPDSHGGSQGLAWELLDSIMLGCFLVVAGLLAEQGWKAWRARRVRYDLTPAGMAATDPVSQVLVDMEALREAVDRGDPLRKAEEG